MRMHGIVKAVAFDCKMQQHDQQPLKATLVFLLIDLFDILNGTEAISSAADSHLQKAREIMAWSQQQAAAAQLALMEAPMVGKVHAV